MLISRAAVSLPSPNANPWDRESISPRRIPNTSDKIPIPQSKCLPQGQAYLSRHQMLTPGVGKQFSLDLTGLPLGQNSHSLNQMLTPRAGLSTPSPNANPWGREEISLDLTLC